MKLVSFHLMPYRPLDLEEAAKHRSPWVVLPNRLYDPVKGAEEYERHIDAVWERLAELGVEDMAITTTVTNVDSHRFYERQGFSQRFAVYYGKSPSASQR